MAALLTNASRALLYPIRRARRASLVPRGAWVTLELEGHLSEVEPPRHRLRSLRELVLRGAQRPTVTVRGLRALCEAVAEDPAVEGILVTVRGVQCGWAVATSVREALSVARAAGKRVVAWLPEGAGAREFFIALAAEKVVGTPQASIMPLGLAAGMTFVRGLLARAGLQAEVYARREFKSAAEAFTRDGYSDANRMQTEALLDRVHGTLVDALVAGRGVDRARAVAWVDGGPFRAVDAVREGLLDAVAYEDQLPGVLGRAEAIKRVPAGAYLALARALRFEPFARARRVGIVQVRGPIVSGRGVSTGRVADARAIVAALRAARAREDLGAVVLHVDTRGGSALASDVIAREVERLKEKKPVVACFSDVAASGGYYVAALANEIVAQPTTVTGSIGVIAMRVLAVELLEKLGLTHEVIRRGARGDLLSPYRVWTDDDRAAFEREIDGFYDDFVGIVARGRGREPAAIEALARGRVYAGGDALSVGLVDSLGGLDHALDRARALSGEGLAREPVVVAPPRGAPEPAEPQGAVRALVEALGVGAELDAELLSIALDAGSEHLFAWSDVSI